MTGHCRLGAGIFQFQPKESAKIIVAALLEWSEKIEGSLCTSVLLFDRNPQMVQEFKNALSAATSE